MAGGDAIRQAIFLMLGTQRGETVIYSSGYGLRLSDLYGKPTEYVEPELQKRIQETLLRDSRVLAVRDFTFQASKGKVSVSFTVDTEFGEVPAAKEAEI